MQAGDRFEIPHEGETWTIVRSSIHEGGEFVAEVAFEPGKGPPRHFHADEDEVIEIFEGSVTFAMPDGPVTLRAGDRLVITAGTPHTFKSGPEGFRGRASYSGRKMEEIVAQLHPGDKRGFVRMAQHMRRTKWAGTRITNPVVRAFLATIAVGGALFGIRPRPV